MARRPKIAVGIALEGSALRIVQLERRRDKSICVTAMRRASLICDEQEEQAVEEGVEVAAGVAQEGASSAASADRRDPFTLPPELAQDIGGGDADGAPVVAAMLAGVEDFDLRHVAVNVPDTHVFYHHMSWEGKTNRKALLQQARAALESGSGGLATESIGAISDPDGNVISAARIGDCPVAEAALAAEEFLEKKKIGVISAVPDELALADLVRRLAPPAEEQTLTAVVHLAEESTRVILMRGETVLRVAPIIHESLESRSLPRTLVSRVLLARDEAGIPSVDRFVLTGSAQWVEAADWLRPEFPDAEVSYLDLGPLDVSEDANTDVVDRFAVSLGLAWSLLDPPEPHRWIDLLPQEIRERNLRGLAWHGVAGATLVGVCSGFLILAALGQVRLEREARAELASVQVQIAEVEDAAMRSMALAEEADEMETALARLQALADTRKLWSEVLTNAASHFRRIGGCWINVVASTKDSGMELQGMTVRRPRLAELANRMGDVVLRSATELRVRTRPVYRFELRAGKDVEDEIEAAQALAAALAASREGADPVSAAPTPDPLGGTESGPPPPPPGAGPGGSTDV